MGIFSDSGLIASSILTLLFGQYTSQFHSNTANTLEFNQFQPTASGKVTQLKINGFTSGNARIGIYSDTGADKPGALLASITTPIVAGDNTVSFPATQLNAGTKYWLAVIYDTDGLVWTQYPNPGLAYYCSNTYAAGLPANAPGTLTDWQETFAIEGFG